ncbi:hypothetical protein SELMODRAFT_408446 [Selaginella moellendorffii]|uniref:Uncharacterized protein n=1 Tax=Selaginella moellendorffii TaxID=88036 RepID=D8R8B4_SELML|nr:hypothetical protein SELMODRAFT_408446 [Selaginella moellendorffii]
MAADKPSIQISPIAQEAPRWSGEYEDKGRETDSSTRSFPEEVPPPFELQGSDAREAEIVYIERKYLSREEDYHQDTSRTNTFFYFLTSCSSRLKNMFFLTVQVSRCTTVAGIAIQQPFVKFTTPVTGSSLVPQAARPKPKIAPLVNRPVSPILPEGFVLKAPVCGHPWPPEGKNTNKTDNDETKGGGDS